MQIKAEKDEEERKKRKADGVDESKDAERKKRKKEEEEKDAMGVSEKEMGKLSSLANHSSAFSTDACIVRISQRAIVRTENIDSMIHCFKWAKMNSCLCKLSLSLSLDLIAFLYVVNFSICFVCTVSILDVLDYPASNSSIFANFLLLCSLPSPPLATLVPFPIYHRTIYLVVRCFSTRRLSQTLPANSPLRPSSF